MFDQELNQTAFLNSLKSKDVPFKDTFFLSVYEHFKHYLIRFKLPTNDKM